MARNKGTFDYSNNFEVRSRSPLDAKQLVATKSDLTGSTTWLSNNGDEWTYVGMFVSVYNDPDPVNNGIYRLTGGTYNQIGNWEMLGTGGAGSSSLSTALSTEISDRISGDTSLSNIISGSTDITTNLANGQLLYLNVTELSGTTNLFPSLSTALSTEISNRGSGDTSLSTALLSTVTKVGTPLDNQVGVWTGNGTIEGTSGFTFNNNQLEFTSDITVRGVDGTSLSVNGKSITIQAGEPYNTPSADAGTIIIKAGGALIGDVSSSAGKIQLIPGDSQNPYNDPGYVILGDTSTSQTTTFYLGVNGISPNVSLTIASKGAGSLQLNAGTGSIDMFSSTLNMNGLQWDSALYNLGFEQTSKISPLLPYSPSDGHSLSIKGGGAYTVSDNYNGGNLYLYGGSGNGTGLTGSIYFGSEIGIPALTGRTIETNVVFYDTSSGKLSYGSSNTPTSNILYWDTNLTAYTPHASKTTFSFYTGTTLPDSTNRLNFDGIIYATQLISDNTRKNTKIILTDQSTIQWSLTGSSSAQVTLTASRTLNITDTISGDNGTIIVIQGGTGSYTLTLPVGSLVVNSGGGSITLSTAVGSKDVLSFYYDGTNYFWNIGLNYN